VRQLEDRTVPTTFNLANGEVQGLINAINTTNTDNQSDIINLAPNGLRPHAGLLTGVAFSPDGKRLACAYEDGYVVIVGRLREAGGPGERQPGGG
jgi:hypothetical protein